MKLSRLFAAAALCLGATVSALAAEAYPTHPMELVVAYQAGGGSDNMARAIADAAKPPLLTESTVVINKPGASGSIGWAYVATARPDGYRLVLMTPEMLVVPLMGIGKTTVDDFQPIARFTDDASSITVRADAPWNTIDEFLAYAKANPDKVAISNAGNGTIPHMAAAAMGEKYGLALTHVPYQGSSPAILGLLAGDVQATTVAFAELRQYVEAGKLKTLAVMAQSRLAALDKVPTFKEKGADLNFSVWRGIGVPKDTPREIVEKWRDAAQKISQSPAFLAVVQKQNLTFSYADTPAFTRDIKRQAEAFKTLFPKLKLTQ